jgi:D-amino-acid dehydrogenase
MKNVVIAGGGVIGLCCAYYLQKKGHQVTVIERGDITDGTSFGNAGYVSPSHFIPLASPGVIAMGLRWMLSSSSPFYIKPKADKDLIRWCLTFYRNANASVVEKNSPHLANILLFSRELTSDIRKEINVPFFMEEKGCFMLYRSAHTEKHEIELARDAKKFGIETRVLSGKEVQEMEPEVEVRVRGGVLYPIDCHLHPGQLMHALAKSLQSSGVKMLLNTEITGFETNGSTINGVITGSGRVACDELVLAAGSWTPLLAKKLKIDLLMQAGKGYSFTYKDIEHNLHYPAILVDNRVAMTPMGPDLRMGGTMEISGINKNILLKRVHAIYNAAIDYYPNLNVKFPEEKKIWNGLRPLTPDGLPYLGRQKNYRNLTVAGGHAMLGISLAAGTGKLVQQIIDGEETEIDIKAFAVDRFR